MLCHARVDGYKDREHNSLLPEEVFGSGNRYVKKIFFTYHFTVDRTLMLCHARVDGYKDREHNSLLPEEVFG